MVTRTYTHTNTQFITLCLYKWIRDNSVDFCVYKITFYMPLKEGQWIVSVTKLSITSTDLAMLLWLLAEKKGRDKNAPFTSLIIQWSCFFPRGHLWWCQFWMLIYFKLTGTWQFSDGKIDERRPKCLEAMVNCLSCCPAKSELKWPSDSNTAKIAKGAVIWMSSALEEALSLHRVCKYTKAN